MNYAKLINGQIHYAPRKLRLETVTVYNPPAELLIAEGYKPVKYTDAPEVNPGWIAVPGWEETAEEIVQVWTVELAPVTEDEALVRFSNELTGAADETLEEAAETLIKQKMEE